MVLIFKKINEDESLLTYHTPWFTLGFTLGIVHSVGLDNCIIICINHYNVIQSVFTALKILCAFSI